MNDILSAHSVRGVPPSEIMIPYPSIRSLVESQVRRYGNRTFVISYAGDGTRTALSYKQFYTAISQAANFLKSQDVTFGSRIAIPARKDLLTLIEYFGTWMIGAVSVPVQGDHEDHPKASSIFLETGDRLLEIIRDQPEEFQVGKKSKLGDDVLIICQRSKTGAWKKIVLSHYNVLVTAMAVAHWYGLTDEQTLFCAVPFTEATGIIGGVMTALYGGYRLVIRIECQPEVFFQLADHEGVQAAVVDTRWLTALLTSLDVSPKRRPSSLRYLISSHRNLKADTVLKIHQKSGVRVMPGFELAETTCFSSFLPVSLSDKQFLRWMASEKGLPVGTPLHPTEMNILGPDGKERPEGEVGRIAVRGHNVMDRYLDDEESSLKAFKFGWLNTTENGLYTLSSDGNRYFTVTER